MKKKTSFKPIPKFHRGQVVYWISTDEYWTIRDSIFCEKHWHYNLTRGPSKAEIRSKFVCEEVLSPLTRSEAGR
jgi:hypothetical protein